MPVSLAFPIGNNPRPGGSDGRFGSNFDGNGNGLYSGKRPKSQPPKREFALECVLSRILCRKILFFEPPSPDWQRFCRTTSSLGRNQSAHSGTPPPIPQRQKAVKGRRSGMPQLQPSARHRLCLFRSRGWQTGKQITVPFHPGNLAETVPLSLAHEQTMLSVPSFPRSSQKGSSCKGTVSNPGRKANEEGFKPTFLRTNCWRPSREKQYTLPETM